MPAPAIYYVRPGGYDLSNGLTPTTAWATLEHAARRVDAVDFDRPAIIDVTGMDIVGADTFALGARSLGPINFDLDPQAPVPNNFISRRHRQLRSEMRVVSTVTQVGETFDPVNKILTVSVSQMLIPASLIGLRLIGSQPGVYGVVRGNGTNTIEVTNTTGVYPGPGGLLWLCGPGATLTFGSASNPLTQALYLQALCDWSLHGLSIRSHGKATALDIYGSMPVDLRLCDIAGIQLAGQAPVTLDGCYVLGPATFAHDSGALIGMQSLFRGLNFVCHGSSGITQFEGCCFDANPTAFGGGGGSAGAYSYRVDNGGARGNLGAAFVASGGRTSFRDTVCQGSGQADIVVQDQAHGTTTNVMATIG